MPHPLITLEAIYVLDAISRRGSFAAAAKELDRAPSSLSYQVQKLEQDLDMVIFDRSGHRAVFTQAGELLLERGRHLMAATQSMVEDASLLAHGWELSLTIAYDALLPVTHLFPLVDILDKKAPTQIKFQEEILAGCWEALLEGRADILIAPRLEHIPSDFKFETLGFFEQKWVAAKDHPVHQRTSDCFTPQTQKNYRIIAVADSAINTPKQSYNVLEKQRCLTVTNMAAKVSAIDAGLGIGTIPEFMAKSFLESGQWLEIARSEHPRLEMIIAWRRNTMGKAKALCIQELKKKWFTRIFAMK